MKFGIYRPEGMENEEVLVALERELEVSIGIRSVYRAWNCCNIDDDLEWFASLAECRRDVLLTWEPWQLPSGSARPEAQPDFSLQQLLSGRYDSYIRDVARTLASLPLKIYLRPMHEMNGNWYPWCGTVNGNSPAEYVLVWHHLRKIFIEEGADAIDWVWCPYAFSYPDAMENGFAAYHPGDAAMEAIGLDGYNWGDKAGYGGWQSFSDLFSDAYGRATELSDKSVMITEMASAEGGGDKTAWLGDMFDRMTTLYPRVEAVFWFDVDKECDWRIHSSAASLELFRERAAVLFGAPV